MKFETKILVSAAILGLVLGSATSELQKPKESYCDKTENAIRQNTSLEGAIACFEPGTVDFNLTEEVEQGSNLKCVCRRSFEGNVQYWAISKAD